MRLRRDLAWPLVVAASTLAAVVVFTFGLGPPLGPIVALWFVFVCPGLPFVRLLELREPLTEMLLAVALSWSLIAVVGLGLVLAGAWSALLALQIVVGITILGVTLESGRVMVRHRRLARVG